MKETNKKRSAEDNIKEPDKLIYITVAVMLVVMAIIIGATASYSRAQKGKLPDPTVTDPITLRPTPSTDTPPKIEQKTDHPTDPVTDPVTEPITEPTVSPSIPTLIAPVSSGTVIKPHSPDTLIHSLTMNDYRAHLGIDITASAGDAVFCCADGIVKEIWTDPMMGKCISISHAGGLVSVLKNLDPQLADGIAVGKELKAGDIIGAAGESALIEISEVCHVHFETFVDGKQTDPLSFFDSSVFADASEDYEG